VADGKAWCVTCYWPADGLLLPDPGTGRLLQRAWVRRRRCDWFCDLAQKKMSPTKKNVCLTKILIFLEVNYWKLLWKGLFIPPNIFLEVEKHHVSRKKILDTLRDALKIVWVIRP
jgi:hypothetical protein